MVQSPATGRSWSAPGGSGQTAPLDRWQDTTGNNQWCKLADGGGSYHRLVNARNETWCADVDSGSMTVGARVIPWPAGTNTNQEWQSVGL
ncbi:RICIN domain-containing protein [Streptomyces sp. NPDC014892]|uniref:RICIN domain-containing protein n=1 Tax=Streptomyces sp. NPDC014892 TaxID=3364930 RepID=UPI0037001E00